MNAITFQSGINLFEGYFRVTGRVAFVNTAGQPRIRVRLSDSHGDVIGVLNPNKIALPERLGYLGAVFVTGWKPTNASTETPTYNLLRITPVQDTYCLSIPGLQLLPRRLCSDSNLFGRLLKLVESLTDPRLKHCVALVLEHPTVSESFLNAPASSRYHHSEQHGLLRHSLEVAHAVSVMIDLFEPDICQVLNENGHRWVTWGDVFF